MKNRFHRLKEIFNSKIGSKIKHKKIFWGSIAGCTGLAVILAGGFFLQVKGASKDQAETTVQSAEAKTGTISTTVEGTGSVSNGATTDVVVPTGIKVKEVLVENGDTVEEGQVLATLDEASIASELLEVKENIESVEDEIADLSNDAGTEGTTEYLEAKVLNGELEELQEAETTLTSLLETQTITAICAGTVSSINVEADTEIIKSSGSSGSSSSGNSSSGSSNTGSSSGSSASAGTTGVSTGAADSTGNNSSDSTSSSESTSGSDSTSSDTSTTGSYSLMFLSAQTGSSAVYTTTAADDTSTQSSQSSEGTAVQTAEVSTTDTTEKITSVDLDVTAPKTGAKPQDTIEETDQYTGTISWNCSSDAFEAGTSYTADIRLTEKDGYVFSAKILPEIKGADVTFEVRENDAGQSVLRIKAKFSKTSSKTENSNNSNNNSNNNNSNNGNTSGSSVSSETAGSGSGTTGNASGVTGNTSGESGNESGTSGSVGSSSGGTSADASGDTSDSASTATSQYSAYETAAFSIASDDKATVSINVDELDITSVKTGQTAKITLDAIEGEEFEGTITSVYSEASSGSSSAKYPVEITFDKTDDMRIGMTASASISIDEAEDAVLIPVDALQEKGGKTFVYTKKDSDGNLSGEVEVETGLSNGNKVEITNGLESGDTIYYLKTTSSSSSNSQQDMQGGPGGNGGEAPSDMRGGSGGDSGEAPSDMGGSGGPGRQSGNSSN